MSRIEARFEVRYPGFALDVTLDLPGRGVTALFGPSGCGKTTCLRAMAGLLHAPGGRLRVQGEVWQDDHRFVPTHRRPLGYVAQDAALFPHLTVRGNVEYGMTRVPAAQRKVSIDQAVALLGIDALMGRRPDALSGGERQRVAMARALATSPRLIIAGEPTGQLDSLNAEAMMSLIASLVHERGVSAIVSTHDPRTAAHADRVLEIHDGHLGRRHGRHNLPRGGPMQPGLWLGLWRLWRPGGLGPGQ